MKKRRNGSRSPDISDAQAGTSDVCPLSDKHVKDIKERGFTELWIDTYFISAGIRSVSEEEVENLLWQGIGSGGIYIPMKEGFIIRLDKPWQPPDGKGKPAKYLSPPSSKPSVWYSDHHGPVKYATEGFFDALMITLKTGISCAAIPGVWQSNVLEPFKDSLEVIIYDADASTNPHVFWPLIEAGREFGCRVQTFPVVDGDGKAGANEYFKQYEPSDFKALVASAMEPDDFLMELPKHWNGLDRRKRRECVKRGVILAWQFGPIDFGDFQGVLNSELGIQKGQSRDILSAVKKQAESDLAAKFEREKSNGVRWDAASQSWYTYSLGLWKRASEEAISGLVQKFLDKLCFGGYSLKTVKGVIGLIRPLLEIERWDEPNNLIPCANGVLDVGTMTLKPHDPEYGFRYQLPYAYDPQACCPSIQAWMDDMFEGPEAVQSFLAELRLLLAPGSLQAVREILGPGGTGKSTATRFGVGLVGLENTMITSLRRLEGRFELSRLYGKRLLLINDSERYGGNVDTLKQISGGDVLPYEQKGIRTDTGVQNFTFTGRVWIAANEPVQSTDLTSGFQRRRRVTLMEKRIPPGRQRALLEIQNNKLVGEFVSEMPGLLNLVLQMSHDTARQIIGKEVSALRLITSTNRIAGWLQENTVYVPPSERHIRTQVGIATRDKDSGSKKLYQESDKWLYANYREWSEANGYTAISCHRFKTNVVDLLRNQLQIDLGCDTRANGMRDEKGSYIPQITLKKGLSEYSDPVTYAARQFGILDRPPENNETDAFDASLTPRTLTTDGFDASDAFLKLRVEKNESNQGNEDTLFHIEKKSKKPSKPSKPSAIRDSEIAYPSKPSALTHPLPTNTPVDPTTDFTMPTSHQPEPPAGVRRLHPGESPAEGTTAYFFDGTTWVNGHRVQSVDQQQALVRLTGPSGEIDVCMGRMAIAE